eukprot:CAMPEP_0170059042 /NCGR_PEP_ID=MMETSP0019_2-20121128/1453_1 /TAXON_ID=98059 /ORGANISM="Dinobryon sp., Strain UTEXLB2267" /LENGTH=413 /DNA_ID=CAMNT_0010264163 /DNA_START=108 /DNA_END=1349 /DNA_ORIENTATION=+
MALRIYKVEPLYGFRPSESDDAVTSVENYKSQFHSAINLVDFIQNPLPPLPLKNEIHLHWLAVNGCQPLVHENPSTLIVRVEDQPTSLPKEMQQLCARITGIVLAVDEASSHSPALLAVYNVFASDAGLQPLVPYFSRFFYSQIKANCRRLPLLKTIIRCIGSLLRNGDVSLGFHLQQLLPAVFTCIVAARLSNSPAEDHWSLRRMAAGVIAAISSQYSDKVPDLHARICKTYLDALQLPSADAANTIASTSGSICHSTVFGGVVGLAALGQQVVRGVLLPLVRPLLERLQRDLDLHTGVIQRGVKRSAAALTSGSEEAATSTWIAKSKATKAAMSKETLGSMEATLAVEMCRQALLQALGRYMIHCMRLPTLVTDKVNRGSTVKVSPLGLEEALIPYYVSISKQDYYCRMFI